MSRCESLFTHFAWEAVTPVKPLNSFLYLWLIFNYCFLLTIWLSYYTYVGLPDCPPHLLIFKKLYSSHCLFLSEFWVNSLSWSYNLLTGFSVMFSIAGHQYFAHEINFSRCWVFPFNEGIFLSNLLGSTWIGDFLRICLPHWPCCMNLGTRTDLLPVGSCCSWSSVTHLCPTSLLKKKKKNHCGTFYRYRGFSQHCPAPVLVQERSLASAGPGLEGTLGAPEGWTTGQRSINFLICIMARDWNPGVN